MSTIEEIAENFFVLSDTVPADRPRSWLPEHTTGFEPFNKYLVLSNDHALLVDTGVASHRGPVLQALERMLGARRLTVMVTRGELDNIGNLGAVVDRFPELRVLSVTKNLPLLGLVHLVKSRPGLAAERIPVGGSLAEFGFPRLRPVNAVIRTLSTVWLLDEVSGILCTSDFFSADLLQRADDPLVRRNADSHPSPEVLRRHVLAKFDWLERARLSELRATWNRFFGEIEPTTLAPGLGRIQQGRDLVQRVIGSYRTAVFGPETAVSAGPADRVETRN